MAATLTATPNPVLINAGQTTGKTTIAWNGDVEGPCQVGKWRALLKHRSPRRLS